MGAAEYLLEFAEMRVTPAPADVLACCQKLDKDSLSMDIHRNCVKALDLVCHEFKALLEPLVVRGSSDPHSHESATERTTTRCAFSGRAPAQSSRGETLRDPSAV